MDDKIDWAEIPVGHVGPFPESPREETVIAAPVNKPVVANVADHDLTDSGGESSGMELDSSGMGLFLISAKRIFEIVA